MQDSKQLVTLKNIADVAGVSIKTVSRVVNNDGEVSEETRRRIQQIIDDLGYYPNTIARNLVNGRSNTVGLVIQHSANYIFSHPFFNEVMRGIAETLSEHNINLLIHLAHKDMPYSHLYYQRLVDGLIFISIPVNDPNLPELSENNFPSIFTCRIAEENNPTCWVDSDFIDGMEQAIDHLYSLNHRRMALLAGPENLISVRLRVKGYKKALTERGIPVDESLIYYMDFSSDAGRTFALQLMKSPNPPTAILCGDDMIAIGAVQGLSEAGWHVPQDVSVIGFDDIELARFSTPPLTSVRQDAFLKGQIAAKTLYRMITKEIDEKPFQQVLPTQLIIRGSTAASPR